MNGAGGGGEGKEDWEIEKGFLKFIISLQRLGGGKEAAKIAADAAVVFLGWNSIKRKISSL